MLVLRHSESTQKSKALLAFLSGLGRGGGRGVFDTRCSFYQRHSPAVDGPTSKYCLRCKLKISLILNVVLKTPVPIWPGKESTKCRRGTFLPASLEPGVSYPDCCVKAVSDVQPTTLLYNLPLFINSIFARSNLTEYFIWIKRSHCTWISDSAPIFLNWNYITSNKRITGSVCVHNFFTFQFWNGEFFLAIFSEN